MGPQNAFHGPRKPKNVSDWDFTPDLSGSAYDIPQTGELHGDGDSGITAVMGLDFMTDTVVIAGMGTAFTVVPW